MASQAAKPSAVPVTGTPAAGVLTAFFDRFSAYIQAFPLAAILGFFLLAPVLMIAVVSFWDYDFARLYPDFVMTNYAETLGSRVTWRIYLNTLKYAAMVWADRKSVV